MYFLKNKINKVKAPQSTRVFKAPMTTNFPISHIIATLWLIILTIANHAGVPIKKNGITINSILKKRSALAVFKTGRAKRPIKNPQKAPR